jgi:multiple sugar transport system ATP-binding protein
VEQMGAPLELYDRPANLFVAGFIGSPAMNMIKGTIRGTGFETESGNRLPLPAVPAGSEGRRAIYGVRPEHIHLAGDGVPAEVVVVEPTGAETQVVVKAAGDELICVFRERISAKPGETIRITPELRLIHLFDAGDGRRLSA